MRPSRTSPKRSHGGCDQLEVACIGEELEDLGERAIDDLGSFEAVDPNEAPPLHQDAALGQGAPALANAD
jgi:hypothetical protein